MVPALIRTLRHRWRSLRYNWPLPDAAAPPATGPALRVCVEKQGLDYVNDLLKLVNLPVRRMHEVTETSEPCMYIRHDVDHSLERANAIAEVEARHGYTSTFFLLTPGSYPGAKGMSNYYGELSDDGEITHHPELLDRCRRIVDHGHDLGFHTDLIPLSLRTGRPAGDILAREVEFFDRAGLKLRGVAAHGNPLCRQLAFNNRELFEGCIRSGWEPGRTITHAGRSVRLHSLRLEDFGFAYEAYSLPRDSRISESGLHWGGRIAGERIPKEELAASFDLERFRTIVSRATAENGVRAMSIMTHPIYWTPKYA